MGKKKISTIATDATSSGAAARSGPNPPKRSASHAPPLSPAPPAPSSSTAGSAPDDWPASTATKRDEKKAKSLGYIPSEEGNVILPNPIDPDYVQDPNDFEKEIPQSPWGLIRGKHELESRACDPVNPEAILIDPKSAANDISDTAGSMHDDDTSPTNPTQEIFSELEETKAHGLISTSFQKTEEDTKWGHRSRHHRAARPGASATYGVGPQAPSDSALRLLKLSLRRKPKHCLQRGHPVVLPMMTFGILMKTSSSLHPRSLKPVLPHRILHSEASGPGTVPAAQISTASSLSKGKNIPSADVAAAPPSGKHDLRVVISSLESFASHYASLEVDKAQLQKEVESSSSKLEGAIKIAAEARTEIDTLKEELKELKQRLKDEEAAKLTAGRAADIPVEALDKVPSNSPSNALSMTLASHQLAQELLQKGKGAMARIHSMIFPKISQDKTLGQLIDAFAVNTREVIEVFKRTSRTYGALLAFQLMMGHGFKENIEEMSKELPKGPDGKAVDLGAFKASALICARQLLELVETKKSSAGPSLSNQTQAP
ncbi:hypothetical protein QYE76_012077 [Lolium multiflorum]|uniref:FRIGIDA-like protein n=1 Tax=Lolium multiflorum TaxID=4521 RepID=A0AAD8TWJ4_LOLMU|nr:hypothetical protein QYE76_012077 [Lolium multiflorum]